MAAITPVPLEEALQRRTAKQPSARTLRTRRIAEDAETIAAAVNQTGAAMVTLTEEDGSIERYLHSLRGAIKRKGYADLLVQKRRGQDQVVVWRARPEDQARLEARRRTGARMGLMAKQRAAGRRRR